MIKALCDVLFNIFGFGLVRSEAKVLACCLVNLVTQGSIACTRLNFDTYFHAITALLCGFLVLSKVQKPIQ